MSCRPERPAPRSGLDARLSSLSPARRGAFLFVCAGLVFVGTDALTKSLVASLPVVDVIWGRHLMYVAAVLILAGRNHPRRLLVTSRLRTQVARGLAMFGATASFFFALSLLPLATVSTLSSTTPFIIIGLAGPLLGERVTRSALVGALVGFAGVLVLVGVDPSHLDVSMLVPLGTACSFALFSLLTRELRSERPDVTLFYSGLVGMAAATALFVVVPTSTSPQPWQWLAIGVVGLTALTGHRLLVAAYSWGRASDLAPLGYLTLIWSFLIGMIVFGEPLQVRTLVGAAAIAVGGIVALLSTPAEEREIIQTSVDYGDPVGGPD